MRVRIRSKWAGERAGYPLRGASFLVSIGLHAFAILLVHQVPGQRRLPPRPAAEGVVRLSEHKVIYYNFRQKLPEVRPFQDLGGAAPQRGAERASQAVIAASPDPKSSTQFIWLPTPKIELRRDLKVPDWIARMASRALSVPPPPENKPPPPASEGVAVQRPAPKVFLPPAQVRRPPRLPVDSALVEQPSPSLHAGEAAPVPAPAVAAFSEDLPPPPAAPRAAVPSPGDGTVDVAIASLNPPVAATREMPEGSRPGRFSKAPMGGAAVPGGTGSSGALVVPDLSVAAGGSKSREAPVVPPPARAMLYAEQVRNIPLSTLSIPLRPSARMIPAAVDGRFQGRSVYTMVIPIENMPEYAGDWILWFAEREPKQGERPLVRAPLPFRKLQWVAQSAPDRTTQRILVVATLGKDGKVSGVSVLTKVEPVYEQAVVEDIKAWDFTAATRNGTPVEVDVVIEIPFRLPPAVSARPGPRAADAAQ